MAEIYENPRFKKRDLINLIPFCSEVTEFLKYAYRFINQRPPFGYVSKRQENLEKEIDKVKKIFCENPSSESE